jgi:membrane protease YdiL (CAAX protease family)
MHLMLGALLFYVLSAFWVSLHSGTTPAAPNALRAFGATMTFQGAVVVMLWFFTRKHSVTLREAFGFHLSPRHAVLLGVTAALALTPVMLGLKAGVLQLAASLGLELPEQHAVTMLRDSNTLLGRAVLGFMAVVAAPVAEEGLFRGVLYPTLRRHGFPRAAIWITSFAFALIHFNIPIFLPLILLAYVLTRLYDKTGNLLACIACHATFNGFNFVMFLVTGGSSS